MKKLLLFFLFAFLPMVASADYSGTCGDNLTWTYVEATQTLTISGTGAMDNYAPGNIPWSNYSIQEVKIEEGVTAIGSYAFSVCSSMTNVTIPNTVTTIGHYAFYRCKHLSNITIPNSVTTIGNCAFRDCSGLTNVAIPSSVTSLGGRVFNGTGWYDNQPNGLIYLGLFAYEYKGTMPSNTNIEIEEGTIGIAGGAFSRCSGLTSITIPNSVTTIGEEAFLGCSGLTNVIIPNFVTSIGDRVFCNCSALTSVTIGNSITTISGGAFSGCFGLTSIIIPNSVNIIGEGAFKDCSGLTSITIPNSVTSINECAFENCTNLMSITIPNSVTSIGSYVFSGCSRLTYVTFPNSIITISYGMFEGCSSLISVTIPNSVTSIENYAFSGCDNLAKVYCYPEEPAALGLNVFTSSPYIFVSESAFPSYQSSPSWKSQKIRTKEIEAIEAGGIYYYLGAISLFAEVTKNPNSYDDTHIEIPEDIIYNSKEYSVKYIGDYAFSGCSNMTSVTIPNSVTNIGVSAFSGCSGLTSVTIPNSVTSIGEYAFQNCSGLTSVIIPNSVTSIGDYAFQNCSGLTSVIIPNSVTSIGDYAFSGCSGLTSITVPNSVSTIGAYTFYGCIDLTSITIPNSVTSIGSGAFQDCFGLTSITIPSSVTSIGNYAFSGCSGLTNITIPNSVTSIGGSAFAGCSGLTSVAIPNSVTIIGNATFYGCSSLTGITIPNSVITIGNYAFSGCSGLTSIIIPNSVTSIGNYAFKGCSGLTSITIPNSVTDIGEYAFSGCFSLTYFTIPTSVTNIGKYAFENCYSLRNIVIPNSVTSIGEYTFSGCHGLTSVVLPDNLQIIRKSAFRSCSNLVNITIPASVEYIYQEAFAYCNALEAIDSKSITPPFIYDNSFSDYSIPLIVPEGCVEAYATAQGWKNFTNISEGVFKLTYMVDGEVYKTYDVEYGTAITPEPAPTKEGYTFSCWSEIPETMPAHDVIITGTFIANIYKLTYMVDGEEYKSYEVEFGSTITPEAEPTKEGYTFSGWSEIPEVMPAHDVTVTGSFTINKYKLTYVVDGQTYKTYDMEFGATITPETEPTKEGYTFSGWDGLPETMPAHDVTVTGSFSINTYKLTYIVDGKEYKSYELEYGAAITPEAEPTKEGYTFSGWSEIPATMPAHDVTVTGTFSINKYKLTYVVDGEEYKSYELEYGAVITPEPAPTKEGYVFSGWNGLPKTMPAHTVIVTGMFTKGVYTLTYQVNGEEYKSYQLEFEAAITPEPAIEREGHTFSGWSEIPATMPAHDVTVTSTLTVNKYILTYILDGIEYKTYEVEYGATITPEPAPKKEGYEFSGWSEIPETMPAHMVIVTGSLTPINTSIYNVMAARGEVRIYTAGGKAISRLQKGLNIVVMQDGTIRKVLY